MFVAYEIDTMEYKVEVSDEMKKIMVVWTFMHSLPAPYTSHRCFSTHQSLMSNATGTSRHTCFQVPFALLMSMRD